MHPSASPRKKDERSGLRRSFDQSHATFFRAREIAFDESLHGTPGLMLDFVVDWPFTKFRDPRAFSFVEQIVVSVRQIPQNPDADLLHPY